LFILTLFYTEAVALEVLAVALVELDLELLNSDL
jgi:hypothetical protein